MNKSQLQYRHKTTYAYRASNITTSNRMQPLYDDLILLVLPLCNNERSEIKSRGNGKHK